MKERKKSLDDIGPSWTLFLDRDGIINEKIEDDYVRRWSEFRFIPSFLENIGPLSEKFKRIVVVTNQRCVARKLVTKVQLLAIHRKMLSFINKAGGRIDRIYYCPHDKSDGCDCRKPGTGMALKAARELKGIDLKRSVMVGDSPSDIEFGKNAGMVTVLISKKAMRGCSVKADHRFRDFQGFSSRVLSSGRRTRSISKRRCL